MDSVTSLTCTGFESVMSWSPNSRYVLYQYEDAYGIAEPETGRTMVLTQELSLQSGTIVWSPDGLSLAGIAFDSAERTSSLVVFSVDGLSVMKVGNSELVDAQSIQDLVWLQP